MTKNSLLEVASTTLISFAVGRQQ